MKKIIILLLALTMIFCFNSIAEQNNVDPEQWLEVAAMGLSNEVMLDIYNDYEKAWLTYPDAIDEAMKYEKQVSQTIAQKYNITPEQADLVYMYVVTNYEKVANGGVEHYRTYSLKYGELLSVNNAVGSTAIIKARIKPSLTNKLTINQNYYNVCDLIQNQGLDEFQEIQYWAVADLDSGREGKVISFTVPKTVIDRVAKGNFPENKMGDYVQDLWVLPSLLE